MPLHDFMCNNCEYEFEELHKADERVACPLCSSVARQLVSPLADYTGVNSLTVQYATRKAPANMRDSHLTKVPSDTNFLSKPIGTTRVN